MGSGSAHAVGDGDHAAAAEQRPLRLRGLDDQAVRAQRRVDDSATIAIRAAGFDDRFELTVVDHGGGFEVDTSALRLPDAHIDREGGFGLPLISALTDEIHVVSAADGAEVRVVVYRDRASAPTRSA